MCASTERVTHDPARPALPSLVGAGVHMIGIGGSGMSGAAALLAQLGAKVSGSDRNSFDGLGDLVKRGIRISIGHDAGQLQPGTQFVVVSAAIPESNPELRAARTEGLRILKYAELLGALMHHRRGVAIAGTHGKSTTTALCAHLFRSAGLSPSFVVGARCDQLGGGSGVGNGPHFIVESCEFDRSFLHLRPNSAAILGVETDHLDCYRDLDDIIDAFSQFASNVDSGGVVVCNADDESARMAASAASAEVWTFGLSSGADWRAVHLREDHGRYAFDVIFRGSVVLSVRLAIAGLHNVSNSLAAIALAYHAGGDKSHLWDPARIAEAVSGFTGVDRRLSFRGRGRGVVVVDDYAHHPTEIRAGLLAMGQRYHPKRTWVVFQPHQSGRTRHFMDAFADALRGVDEVVILDVYGAREFGGGDKSHLWASRLAMELVSKITQRGGRARHATSFRAAVELLSKGMKSGDLALTMGAGDVWKVADELVEHFCGPDGNRRATGVDDVVSTRGAGTVSIPAA